MIYLIASFIIVNITHGLLLINLRGDHPGSISYHAIKNSRTLLFYRAGHFVAGLLLGLLVLSKFTTGPYAAVVIAITIVSILAEWAQAIVPAKGKSDKLHTILAAIMALSMVALGLVCTILFSPNLMIYAVNMVIFGVLLSLFMFSKYPPRSYFWKLQFIGQNLLYLQILLLIS